MGELSSPKVLVAMPAYNEEKYIGSVVLQARRYADEVMVVDDGSTDQTAQIAELAGATVIRHGENKGYGVAIQRIIAEAEKGGADTLVLLDADSQHDPNDIPSFLKAISAGNDLVIGCRKIQRDAIPLWRRAGQNVLLFLTNILSRGKLSDTESGFRAFSRKAVSQLKLKESGMAVSAETISVATAQGLKITEVPIMAIYTRDGSTLNPIRHGFGVFNRVLVMISERRPLLFFGLFGGIFMVLGIIAGVMVVQTLGERQILQTGTALLSMLFLTIGLLSVFTGIILDVLVRRLSRK
ncbi:MAG: glycosyltransferase family 2 protein [Dehalococcoidia bacterium]|nr:MAG: glycosyltransferase family 2 protein [Dehalococcoidia bacterium]